MENEVKSEAGNPAVEAEETAAEPEPAREPEQLPETFDVGQRFTLGVWGEEPIEWRVLAVEGKRVLVVSERGLDCRKWNGHLRQHNDWETSDIKAWLTGTFLPGAFAEANRAQIAEITLLSHEEVLKHFADDRLDRICFATAFAKKQGAWDGKDHYNGKCGCNWWLRSQGVEAGNAMGVYYGGLISTYGWSVDNPHNAVRPAMWLER